MMTEKIHLKDYLWIVILALLLFLPGIGAAHLFDWDEANFGEAAREMVLTNNWLNPQIDFQLFWEKPPFFIWMQAISMKLFGINEFAARFPNTIIGIATLCSLFYIGNKVVNRRMAWIWVFLYIGSWLMHLYFKSAIIDPTFNLFIFLGFYQFYLAIHKKSILSSFLCGLFIGIAVLTKGPVAILIIGVCGLIFILIRKKFFILSFSQYIVIISSLLITIFLWLGIDIIKNGWWFTESFLMYQYRLFSTQDAGHGGPWYYHPLVLLIGCFPASIFFLNIISKKSFWKGEENKNDFYLLMSLLFFAHLIIFSIVKTKIIHYSSLCYFPLSFWAAVEAEKLISNKSTFLKFTNVLGIIIGCLLAISIFLLPIAGMNLDILKAKINDKFVVGNLEAEVSFYAYESIIGIVILCVVIILFIQINKNKEKRIWIPLVANAFLISATVSHFSPKFEAISQGGAIYFYQKAKEDGKYVYPIMMKSYAYLFYSEKQKSTDKHFPVNLYEVLNRPEYQSLFYIVSKNIHEERVLKENPTLQKIDERAGYVLYSFK